MWLGTSCWGGVAMMEQECTLSLQDSMLGVSKTGALPKGRQQQHVHLELSHTWVLLHPVTLQCCHSVCQGSPGGLELFQGQGPRKPAKNLVLFPQIWTPNRKSEGH